MKNPKLNTLFVIISLGLFWLLFAPVQIGGPVAYVLVDGNSMEPQFQFGDFVLTRRQPDYQIGEAVVYRHPSFGYVFHRIIEQDGPKLILQGDNNAWLDSYQPTKEEVVGKLWLHIPTIGKSIDKLRTPIFLSILVLLIFLTAIVTLSGQQHRRTKFQKSKQMNRPQNNPTPSQDRSEILLILGMLALSAFILGIFAFFRPVQKTVPDNINFTHLGSLFYSAQDTKDVFDAEQIQTGDPIYTQLTCDVDLKFVYVFLSPAFPVDESTPFVGTYQVLAQVSDTYGWYRTINLTPLTNFSGTNISVDMNLNVCQIQNLIDYKEQATGTSGGRYELVIKPEITVQGSIQNKLLEDQFAPEIMFQLDSAVLQVVDGPNDDGDMLEPSRDSFIPQSKLETNTLSIFGLEFPVGMARIISILVFLLSVGGLVWVGWPLYQDWKRDDASRIKIQYSPLLIDVRENGLMTSSRVVELATFQDLSKLAERYGAVILHELHGNSHRYAIQDGDVTYQYQLDTFKAEAVYKEVSTFNKAIRQAITNGELQLYYQPVISMEKNTIVGVEALLRWKHPEHGMLYPGDFLAFAEENGLIGTIDKWVIYLACMQLVKWKKAGYPQVTLSVNISPSWLVQADSIDRIAAILKETSCDPDLLQLEISKANRIVENEIILGKLHQLRDLGIKLAIDNFATSVPHQIEQLARMPINCLKIDRSVMNRNLQQIDTRMMSSVVKMAQSLEISVVAQGVETWDQMAMLDALQIDDAQGFLLSHPVPADEIPSLLAGGPIINGEIS
jgi:signal peptidase I